MNVPRGSKPQSSSELCSQIADDVAEEIASDDDVELTRVANYLHGERVDVKVSGIDLRVFLADLLEDPLPKIVRERQGVGFVAHADALQAIPAGIIEGVADDAFDAFSRIDVFLDSNFVGCSLLEESA